jgi:hypothetical protein
MGAVEVSRCARGVSRGFGGYCFYFFQNLWKRAVSTGFGLLGEWWNYVVELREVCSWGEYEGGKRLFCEERKSKPHTGSGGTNR